MSNPLQDIRCHGEDWTVAGNAIHGEQTSIVKTGRTCPLRDRCGRHIAIAADKAEGRVIVAMADLYDWIGMTCSHYAEATA